MQKTLARVHGGPVTVIATANADDDEMRARIAAHRRDGLPTGPLLRNPFASPMHFAQRRARAASWSSNA